MTWTKCTLSKFANNTKTGGVVNMLERRDAIQQDLDSFECKALYVGQGNSKHKGSLDKDCIEGSPEEKDLGVLIDEKISKRQQCVLAAQ